MHNILCCFVDYPVNSFGDSYSIHTAFVVKNAKVKSRSLFGDKNADAEKDFDIGLHNSRDAPKTSEW